MTTLNSLLHGTAKSVITNHGNGALPKTHTCTNKGQV